MSDLTIYPQYVSCLRQEDFRLLYFGEGDSTELLTEIKEVIDNIKEHKDHLQIDGLEVTLKDIPINYTCRGKPYTSTHVRISFSKGFLLAGRVRVHFVDHATFYEFETDRHKHGRIANKDFYNSLMGFMRMIIKRLRLMPDIVGYDS